MGNLNFYMLVGVPASGKSTFTKDFWRFGDIVVSTDDHIERMAWKENKTYDEVWSSENYKKAEEAALTDFHDAIREGKNIIWDQTNLSPKKRKYILSMVPSNYTKIAVVFDIPPEEEWNRRLASRPGKTIPNHILESMVKNFVLPTREEGFEEILHIQS